MLTIHKNRGSIIFVPTKRQELVCGLGQTYQKVPVAMIFNQCYNKVPAECGLHTCCDAIADAADGRLSYQKMDLEKQGIDMVK